VVLALSGPPSPRPASSGWPSIQDAGWQKSFGSLRIVMVSLGEKRKDLDEAIRLFDIKVAIISTARVGKCRRPPTRINAIPTSWTLRQKGILRTLNAANSYDVWIRRLSARALSFTAAGRQTFPRTLSCQFARLDFFFAPPRPSFRAFVFTQAPDAIRESSTSFAR